MRPSSGTKPVFRARTVLDVPLPPALHSPSVFHSPRPHDTYSLLPRSPRCLVTLFRHGSHNDQQMFATNNALGYGSVLLVVFRVSLRGSRAPSMQSTSTSWFCTVISIATTAWSVSLVCVCQHALLCLKFLTSKCRVLVTYMTILHEFIHKCEASLN